MGGRFSKCNTATSIEAEAPEELTFANYPPDGIVYTSEDVMFRTDVLLDYLPPPTVTLYRPWYVAAWQKIICAARSPISRHDLLTLEQLRGTIGTWWLGDSQVQRLLAEIESSAIGFKPFKGPALYLFYGLTVNNGAAAPIILAHCDNSNRYKSLAQAGAIIIRGQPIMARGFTDSAQPRECVTEMAEILRLVGMQLIELMRGGGRGIYVISGAGAAYAAAAEANPDAAAASVRTAAIDALVAAFDIVAGPQR